MKFEKNHVEPCLKYFACPYDVPWKRLTKVSKQIIDVLCSFKPQFLTKTYKNKFKINITVIHQSLLFINFRNRIESTNKKGKT